MPAELAAGRLSCFSTARRRRSETLATSTRSCSPWRSIAEASGLVDAVTADHSVVWVDLDGGRGRTLLHCSDGVEIRPHDS